MRIADPKRPGQDAEKNFEQLYKWMYQTAEQLNMMMEQLERNNVLDLQAGFGTAAESGLLSGSVAEVDADVKKVQENQIAQAKQIGQLQTQLGDYTILTGVGAIPYGTGAEREEAKVIFDRAFLEPPMVLVGQVFNEANLIVRNESISVTDFDVWLLGTFASTGTRNFKWLAIGKMKEG